MPVVTAIPIAIVRTIAHVMPILRRNCDSACFKSKSMIFYSALPELSPPESNRSAASSDMPLDCAESSLQIALFAVSGWTRGLCITCRGRCEILEHGAEALNSRVFEHESNVNRQDKRLAQPRHHSSSQDGIAAQLEEVVVNAPTRSM